MNRRQHHGRSDLIKAALKRLRDAEQLLQADHGRGAAYLAGYAVECKLKAIALEVYDCWTLHDLATAWEVDDRQVYQHGLEALATRLPLYDNLRRNHVVWRLFASHVNLWKPAWRYDPRPLSRDRAEAFLEAVRRVYNWLDANRC